jgi:hypothetical protein
MDCWFLLFEIMFGSSHRFRRLNFYQTFSIKINAETFLQPRAAIASAVAQKKGICENFSLRLIIEF